MNTDSIKTSLIRKLQDRSYRRSFANAHAGTQVALQLRALRNAIELSQKELADELRMKQPRISVLEDLDYQKYNLSTLKIVADYYDVVLDVRFISFRELVDMIVKDTPDDLAPPPFGIAFGFPLRPPPVKGQGRFGEQKEMPLDELIPKPREQVQVGELLQP